MTARFVPSHLRGGGLGTLAEPAKNEPCETVCRMAGTEIFDFEGGGKRMTTCLLCIISTPLSFTNLTMLQNIKLNLKRLKPLL